MQKYTSPISKNEIDLRELFLSFWAYKFFIATICLLGIFFAGNYITDTDKEYTSTAIFKIDSGNNSMRPLKNLELISSFVGGSLNSSNITLNARISGRNFIEAMDRKLNFQNDNFINRYNKNSVDPLWKAFIKNILGFDENTSDPNEAMWQNIVKNFNKNIHYIVSSKDNSSRIIVTHSDATRAAQIANTVMTTILDDMKSEKTSRSNEELQYLTNMLANALREMETTQTKLKAFALENSALPLETFSAESLQLDALRMQLDRTSKFYYAINELGALISQNKTKYNDYLFLQEKFPIIDQIEFRRILGQNEIISSWNWPDLNSVYAVADTLSDRIKRLESQIDTSRAAAKQSAESLEIYAKLKRNNTISEATYTVLIEQVKAQSMLAGFRPDNSEIYEYASPPIKPSEPKRALIIAFGAVMGFFIGCGITIFLILIRDVYYSKDTIKSLVRADITGSYKSFHSLYKKNIDDFNIYLSNKTIPVLQNFAIEIRNKKSSVITITSLKTKIKSNAIALVLARTIHLRNTKIAILNFSSKNYPNDKISKNDTLGNFIIQKIEGQIYNLTFNGTESLINILHHESFINELNNLSKEFNKVFFMCRRCRCNNFVEKFRES